MKKSILNTFIKKSNISHTQIIDINYITNLTYTTNYYLTANMKIHNL